MALNLLLNNAGLLADNFVHAMTEQSQNPSEWKVYLVIVGLPSRSLTAPPGENRPKPKRVSDCLPLPSIFQGLTAVKLRGW